MMNLLKKMPWKPKDFSKNKLELFWCLSCIQSNVSKSKIIPKKHQWVFSIWITTKNLSMRLMMMCSFSSVDYNSKRREEYLQMATVSQWRHNISCCLRIVGFMVCQLITLTRETIPRLQKFPKSSEVNMISNRIWDPVRLIPLLEKALEILIPRQTVQKKEHNMEKTKLLDSLKLAGLSQLNEGEARGGLEERKIEWKF